MGSGVESRSLEVPACVLQEQARSGGRRGASLGEKAIDIEHPEADALEMKRGNGSRQRLTLLE